MVNVIMQQDVILLVGEDTQISCVYMPLNEPVFSVLAGGESLDLKVCFFFVPTPHADAWKRPPELINSKALFM